MEDLTLHRAPRPVDAKTLKFRLWRDELRNMLDGLSPKDQKRAVALNQDFIRGLNSPKVSVHSSERAVGTAAVHTDAVLTNFSKKYENSEYIGEQLMPVVPVVKRSDIYYTYPKRERLAGPDDALGNRASANELHETRSTDNYSVKDYGLKNFVEMETLRTQDAPLNEMLDLMESILDILALKREKRILTIVTTSGNYDGNTTTATTNWNDSTGGSIVADLLGARSSLWHGGGSVRRIGFCPITVWNSGIANNPAIRELFKYTGSGLAFPSLVASYFRLDDILITEAREDTANEGQTASYARLVTADTFGIVTVANRPTIRSAHFGSTFRTNDSPVTTQWFTPDVGKAGGIYGRSAFSEDYKVVAGDTGFYLTSLLT